MTERVMLLIDADNVSVDVIEQTVKLLVQEHGALHVRRAYCTAESALKHQQIFKRLSIKPMVNLAAGKNSTDIALAVDALDLVLAERPDVVAIASSDSDFAPLVSRLREKGCRVRGFGQAGKTGDETQTVYDDYTVLAHHKASPARATRATRATRSTRSLRSVVSDDDTDTAATAPSKAPRRRASKAGSAVAVATPAPSPAPAAKTVAALPDKVLAILAALPELSRGQVVELRVASERLRDAGLLGQRASSTKFFAPFADRFELLPADQPNKVRYRG
jgi:uncharacterized protein (TIGR00288 family)